MKVVYYTSKKTGETTNFHKIPDDWDDETIIKRLEKFNNDDSIKTTATIVDVVESSFMEYLINCCYQKLEAEREVRDNLIEHLRDALYIAEDIKVKL